jgi:chromosome segregation ATPase
MKKKKENEQKAQMFHEYRKYELINKNLQESLNNKIAEKEEIKKKIVNTNTDVKTNVQEKLLELEQQIEKLENKKKEISEKESELSEKIGLNELQKKLQNNSNNLTV